VQLQLESTKETEVPSIEVDYIGRISVAKMQDMIQAVSLNYATEVMSRMVMAIPRPPARGSMRYKSEKQRRFVMAAIKRGDIKVPYIRGTGSKLNPSRDLNQSYRIDTIGTDAILMSSAPYAKYVVGDSQAEIHKDRWLTATQAADEVHRDGVIDYLVQTAMENL